MLGFELGFIELVGIDESDTDELGRRGLHRRPRVSLAVIVVAPVTEEFFFRGFFYRALRNRLRVWSAALIDGLVFGSLHFQYVANSAVILLVIAVFARRPVPRLRAHRLAVRGDRDPRDLQQLATPAPSRLPAPIVVGTLVLAGCVVVPRAVGRHPSPLPA